MYSDRETSPSAAAPSPQRTSAQRPAPAAPPAELPPDSVLLSRLASRTIDPEALAQELKVPLDLLLDWMRAPTSIARLNTLLESRDMVEQHARETRRHIKCDRMLDELDQLYDRAKTEGDHIEQRRTATVFLRFARAANRADRPHRFAAGFGAPRTPAIDPRLSPELARFLNHDPASPSSDRRGSSRAEPRPRLPAPDRPNPANSPVQTTLRLLHRLQNSDNPSPGDGLRAFFNHFSDQLRAAVNARSADEFARTELAAYHTLRNHHSAVLLPIQVAPIPMDAPAKSPALNATQTVDLIDREGLPFRLMLRYVRASARKPWLIDGLTLKSLPAPNPDLHPPPGLRSSCPSSARPP